MTRFTRREGLLAGLFAGGSIGLRSAFALACESPRALGIGL